MWGFFFSSFFFFKLSLFEEDLTRSFEIWKPQWKLQPLLKPLLYSSVGAEKVMGQMDFQVHALSHAIPPELYLVVSVQISSFHFRVSFCSLASDNYAYDVIGFFTKTISHCKGGKERDA